MPKVQQVFIGCPFRKNLRANYDRLKKEIEAETPLSLVLADTGQVTSTNYLLQHITQLISDSAACVFDATGGNPNVSLEVGIAHVLPADYLLTVSTRKPRTPSEKQAEKEASAQGEVRAIISDLQGKNRIEYKNYKALRKGVEDRFLSGLPFMKRWAAFRAANKDMAPYALKLLQEIRTSGRSQRPRLGAILEGSGFSSTQVASSLVKAKLMHVKRGREGGYFYPVR